MQFKLINTEKSSKTIKGGTLMYDYDTGHFYLDYQGKVVYDLMIRKPLIQVSGQTSAGKSMLINLIEVLVTSLIFVMRRVSTTITYYEN